MIPLVHDRTQRYDRYASTSTSRRIIAELNGDKGKTTPAWMWLVGALVSVCVLLLAVIPASHLEPGFGAGTSKKHPTTCRTQAPVRIGTAIHVGGNWP